jgi:hypothetical protein
VVQNVKEGKKFSNLSFYTFIISSHSPSKLWILGIVAAVVKCLLCKHKALSSNPYSIKTMNYFKVWDSVLLFKIVPLAVGVILSD